MIFCFKNTKKGIILTQEDEEDFKRYNICRFYDKIIESDKVRDHCHLNGKNRKAAHSICDINVTQKQKSFVQFIIHIFSNYDCHLFLKNW